MSALAVLPSLTILVLMLGVGWSASRAGVAGLAVTAVVAVLAFDFPAALPVGPAAASAGLVAEARFTAVTILWIIGPALGIYELQVRSGGTEVLRQALGRLTPTRGSSHCSSPGSSRCSWKEPPASARRWRWRRRSSWAPASARCQRSSPR